MRTVKILLFLWLCRTEWTLRTVQGSLQRVEFVIYSMHYAVCTVNTVTSREVNRYPAVARLVRFDSCPLLTDKSGIGSNCCEYSLMLFTYLSQNNHKTDAYMFQSAQTRRMTSICLHKYNTERYIFCNYIKCHRS